MFKHKNFILFLIVLQSLFTSRAYPCSITTSEKDATNPCVYLYGGWSFFSRSSEYLSFCPYATLVELANGITVIRECKKLHGYSDTNIYSRDNKIFWTGKIGNDRATYRVYPHTANARKDDDFLYQKKFYRPTTPPTKTHEDGLDPNTTVLTRYGEVQISKLRPGWRVIAYDFAHAVWTETLVIATNTACCNFVQVELESSFLECSETQKFYLVKSKEWVCAKDLKENDVLLTMDAYDDDNFVLERVKKVLGKERRTAVSITLAHHHNFCVNNGVVVHNSMYVVDAIGQLVPIFCELASNLFKSFAREVCNFGTFVIADKICKSTTKVIWNPESPNPNSDREGYPIALLPIDLEGSKNLLVKEIDVSRSVFNQGEGTMSKTVSSSVVAASCVLGSLGWLTIPITPLNLLVTINAPSIVLGVGLIAYNYFSKQEHPSEVYRKEQAKFVPAIRSLEEIQKRTLMLEDQDIKNAAAYQNELIQQARARYEALVKTAEEEALKIDLEVEEEVIINSRQALAMAPNNTNGPEIPECLGDDPFGKISIALVKLFVSIRKIFAPTIVEGFASELLELSATLLHLKTINNDKLYSILEKGLNTIKSIQSTPVTISALSSISSQGKELFNSVEATKFFYPFKQGPTIIYKATRNVASWGLESGDFLYVDYQHNGDHIEVFHKKGAVDQNGQDISGMAKDVRNFDSSRNYEKRKHAFGFAINKHTKQWEFRGINEIRSIKHWIGL